MHRAKSSSLPVWKGGWTPTRCKTVTVISTISRWVATWVITNFTIMLQPLGVGTKSSPRDSLMTNQGQGCIWIFKSSNNKRNPTLKRQISSGLVSKLITSSSKVRSLKAPSVTLPFKNAHTYHVTQATLCVSPKRFPIYFQHNKGKRSYSSQTVSPSRDAVPVLHTQYVASHVRQWHLQNIRF